MSEDDRTEDFDLAWAHAEEASDEWYKQPITNEEVAERLQRMQRARAVGPDSVGAEILNDSEDLLIPLATKILNKALDTSSIPKAWDMGHPLNRIKTPGLVTRALLVSATRSKTSFTGSSSHGKIPLASLVSEGPASEC